MNLIKKMSVILVLFTLCSTHAFAENSSSGNDRGRQQGPPPEAYTACDGKSAGDTAEFVSPRGDTVTGTCEEQGDDLVLRPDNPPGGDSKRGGRGSSRR